MTRDEITAALTAVGRLLHARGISGELYMVGGAAIALALDAAARFFVEELFAG